MKYLSFLMFLSSLAFGHENDRIVGIGFATIDLLVKVDEHFVQNHKDNMNFNTPELIDAFLEQAKITPTSIPGGSAANTLRALSKLNLPCTFLSHVGSDPLGKIYTQDMQEYGIEFRTGQSFATTRFLCLITPDGLPFFFGYDGNNPNKSPTPDDFKGAKWLHVECRYLKENEEYLEAALKMAKEMGIGISLELSSVILIEKYREKLISLIEDYAHITFCNNDEIASLFGLSPEEGCQKLQEISPIGVVTLGKDGCLIGANGTVQKIQTYEANVIDTTGAGDNFDAGFLYGYFKGYPLEECGRVGNLIGSSVTEVLGAQLPQEVWEKIYSEL